MEGKTDGSVVSDAVDYRGMPADRSKTGGWIPTAHILGIEVCERLASMGIAVNLVTYLMGTMHLPSSTSANIVTDFLGTSFLLCLPGGLIADSFLGRYKTIAIFALVQTIGIAMLAISTRLPGLHPDLCTNAAYDTCEKPNSFQMAVLYMSLYLIAIGTGGLKSSVSGFGTDQFDVKDEKEKIQMSFYFNRFLVVICIGTLAAVTVLVYIQDDVGRSWAYGLCSLSMFIAVLVFLAGTKRYRYKKVLGSPLVQIFQVSVASIKKAKLNMPSDISLLYEDFPPSSRIPYTDQFCFLDKAAIITEADFEKKGTSSPDPWKLSPVTKIEEVKMVIRLLPIWATTIMFWTTYAQLITFSVEQANTMDRSIGNFTIPPASLNAFFIIALLLTLAVYDRLIMPLWKKWKGNPGFTDLQRIGIGLVISTAGMAAAALAERRRLTVAKEIGVTGSTLPISVFLLIPQFFLVGSAEAFMYTGQLDFFITQPPKGMKTMSTGLFLTTHSLGFFVSSVLVSIVKQITGSDGERKGWLAYNINQGRLDYFYWLLAALCFVNFGFFVLCARWYRPNQPQSDLETEEGCSSIEQFG